jgi:predicted transglutaminase-like cysteine proteinase
MRSHSLALALRAAAAPLATFAAEAGDCEDYAIAK